MLSKPNFIPTIEKNLLWKYIPCIALGFACCSINENILLMLPFGSEIYYHQTTPENIFTIIPHNTLISLATIFFLGLLFYHVNKVLTLGVPIKLHFLPQTISIKTLNTYNTPFYLLLTLYFITTIVIQYSDNQIITNYLILKNILHAIYIQLIIFIGYSVFIIFPPAYACNTYALTILFTIILSEISTHIDHNYLFLIKNIIPFLGILFLILGRPNIKIIQALTIEKTLHINNIFSKKYTLLYVVLCMLSLLSMFQLFLHTKHIIPIANTTMDTKTHHIFIYTLIMQFAGAILVAWFIKWKEHTPLLLFMSIFALLSIGTISQSIFIENNIPLFIIQLALSLAGALCIALLSVLIHNQKHAYTILTCALFCINSMGYLLGYVLWNFSLFIEEYAIAITQIHIPVLSITGIISIILLQIIPYIITKISKLCYLLNLRPIHLDEYAYLNRLQYLTPREKEVLHLVQQGLKNIEISNRLQITESTLRVHLRNTYRKLNINGRQNLKTLPYNPSFNIENTS